MFQGYKSYLSIDTKKNKGINLSSSDDSVKIKNMTNIIKTSFGQFRNRYKCINIYKFENESEPVRQYNDCLKTLFYVKDNGDTELLVYQTYFAKIEPCLNYDYSKVPFTERDKRDQEIKDATDILSTRLAYENGFIKVKKVDEEFTNFEINLEGFNDFALGLVFKYFFNDVQIGIMQSSKNRTPYISDLHLDKRTKKLTFNCNVRYEDLDIDSTDERGNPLEQFSIYPHRAGIFKINSIKNTRQTTGHEELIRNLDPNVFVSYVNYLNNLIIVNGIDSNMYYNGKEITNMFSYLNFSKIVQKFQIKDGNKAKIFFKHVTGTVEIINLLSFFRKTKIGSKIIILTDLYKPRTFSIKNMVEEVDGDGNLIYIEITLNKELPDILLKTEGNAKTLDVSSLNVSTDCLPKFGFITVSRDRLWALGGGRSYRNKHRAKKNKMKVYYSDKRLSLDGWSNIITNLVSYIDCTSKSPVPDCFEAIVPYRSYLIFIGRERSQVWQGETPITNELISQIKTKDSTIDLREKNIFKWMSTIKLGVLNQNMVVEMDNEFVCINKDGLTLIDTNNSAKNIIKKKDINIPIYPLLKTDFQSLKYESQYRQACSFNYEFDNSIGFKISGKVYIINQSEDGFYTSFSGKFSNAKSIDYDFITKTLFLSQGNGLVDVYNDKTTNNSQDYWLIKNVANNHNPNDEGKINWSIMYNWVDIGQTWYNDVIMTDFSSGEKCEISLDVRADYNYGVRYKSIIDKYMDKDLSIDNRNIDWSYDEAPIDAPFSYRHNPYSYVFSKFSCDNLSLFISGKNDFCYFSKIIFCGGRQSEQEV